MKYRISVAHFTSLLSNFINKPALSNKHNNAEPYIFDATFDGILRAKLSQDGGKFYMFIETKFLPLYFL